MNLWSHSEINWPLVETKEINVLELYVYFKFRLANKIVKNARANWNSILFLILLNLLSSPLELKWAVCRYCLTIFFSPLSAPIVSYVFACITMQLWRCCIVLENKVVYIKYSNQFLIFHQVNVICYKNYHNEADTPMITKVLKKNWDPCPRILENISLAIGGVDCLCYVNKLHKNW